MIITILRWLLLSCIVFIESQKWFNIVNIVNLELKIYKKCDRVNRNLKVLHENGIFVPRSKWKIVKKMTHEEVLECVTTIERMRTIQEI
jgi:hypothetical protein